MKTITISEDLYNELYEYFDNRADADYDYETQKMIPNQEMKLFGDLIEAFEKSNNKTK